MCHHAQLWWGFLGGGWEGVGVFVLTVWEEACASILHNKFPTDTLGKSHSFSSLKTGRSVRYFEVSHVVIHLKHLFSFLLKQ